MTDEERWGEGCRGRRSCCERPGGIDNDESRGGVDKECGRGVELDDELPDDKPDRGGNKGNMPGEADSDDEHEHDDCVR